MKHLFEHLRREQMNCCGPFENISKLFQQLFLQLNKTLPVLILPNQFSIPFPNPAEGALTLSLSEAILPKPITRKPLKLAAR